MKPAPFSLSPFPANSWTVHPDRVDLTRKPPAPRVVSLAAVPASVELDLARSAVVVVDMQNDFCHPDGWFGSRGVDLAPVRRPIPVIADMVPPLRQAGAKIVWLNWGIRGDRANLPSGVLYRGKRHAASTGYGEALPNGRGHVLVQGSWGAELVDGMPCRDGDLIVNKHRLSGFWDSELDSVLRQAGITTLLFAGVNIDRCVFSTLQDAGFLGYDCLLVEDACATLSPQYVSDAILFLVREMHGFTVHSRDLLHAAASLPPLMHTADKEPS